MALGEMGLGEMGQNHFQKLDSSAYIFVVGCIWVYLHSILCSGLKRRIFSAPECVLANQGRSGSSKVDDFGTN